MPPDVPVNTDAKAGGTRFSTGKPHGWWYIPMYGLRLVAPLAVRGGEKYAPMDWRVGQSFSTLFDCMTRHFLEIQERGVWAKDDDTGCYHIACMAWNALALLTFMALERHDLDDITPWQDVTYEARTNAEQEAKHTGRGVLDILRERRKQ